MLMIIIDWVEAYVLWKKTEALSVPCRETGMDASAENGMQKCVSFRQNAWKVVSYRKETNPSKL